MKGVFFIFCFLMASLFALERDTWFGRVYEFDATLKYCYSYYPDVEGAISPLKETSYDHLASLGLSFCSDPQVSWDGDIEFAKTPRQSFGFRSAAFQARYLLSDDLAGDLLSLVFGASGRFTSHRSLKDVSCPSHGDVDVEALFTLGKEFGKEKGLRTRLWGQGAVGKANRGSPWVREIVAMEGNYDDLHEFGAFLWFSQGFGHKRMINVDHFHGYGSIRQRSIDLKLRYGYSLDRWGTLRFEYDRRLFAKLCPEKVNSFTLALLFSFSF